MIVHIGAPKTGTTFLQGVLWANKAALAERGVFLPGRRQRSHFSAGNDLLGEDGTRFTKQQRVDGAWDRLLRQVSSSSLPTAVFTDERLSALPAAAIDRVAELAADRELHVVYTVRDLHSLFPSAWQEQVKHGTVAALEPWVRRVLRNRSEGPGRDWFWRVHDVAAVLSRWEAVVDEPSRIHVVTMPADGSGPEELWHRFAAATELPGDVPLGGVATSNPSLDHAQVEFLRRVNAELRERLEPDEYRTWVRERLAKQVLSPRSSGPRAGVPPDAHDEITRVGEEFVEHVAAAGYSIAGSLDDLAPRARTAPAALPTPEEVLAAGVGATAGLIDGLIQDLRDGRTVAAHSDETRPRPVAEAGVDLARRSPAGRWLLGRYRTLRSAVRNRNVRRG